MEEDAPPMTADRDGATAFPTAASLHRLGTSPADESPSDELDAALDQTRNWLLDHQKPDGHWVGELEGDTILESEYVLLMAYLGREREPICRRLADYLLDRQRPEGGWAIYPGGPFELSASVKAYFALKLVGLPGSHPALIRARKLIQVAGGAQGCNSFTRFYLALLGQIPYAECPTVPPELALVPKHWGFSLSAMSAWTRTIVVPLSIWSAFRPLRAVEPERGVAELFRDDLPRATWKRRRGLNWESFFLGIDRVLKLLDRCLPRASRRAGIRAAHRWMLEHFEDSDGLGAIYPPMISTVIALKCLGYGDDHELMRWAFRHLDDLFIDDRRGLRVQPCVSPVWDTAIATIALADAGAAGSHPALRRAAGWLLDREIQHAGDWAARRPGVEPSGWNFQYQNGHYPDIDDTAMVLLALRRSTPNGDARGLAATRRAVNWLLAMQNRDGGWAAFDVDIDNEVLTKVPFADHNAMLDPSCADITARVLEVLGEQGYRAEHPAVAQALGYLWATQEPEGCWYGRWGVNYLYGTWQVLLGLRSIDFPMDHPRVRRAADWLESVQQDCGGWGEGCASYDDPALKAQGVPTASQTAWSVLGLIAAGRARSKSVRRGIEFLIATQNADGTWDEDQFTGTGFPSVFYLKYHYYRIYFPLMALARYRAALATEAPPAARPVMPALAARIPASPRAGEV
jgi:squalene-hopene/tetraprenyl-beta-curcumene cyclase